MKKQFLKTVVATLVLGAASAGALAQNIAIVNGKPVPKARVDALAQQLAANGRPVTPGRQGRNKRPRQSSLMFRRARISLPGLK